MIDQEKEAFYRAGESARSLRQAIEADNRKKEALAAELAQLPQVIGALAQAEAGYREAASQRSQAQESVGSIKAKLQRLAEQETRKKEKESQLSEAAKEGNIYKELAKAFGKTGVQALLIEMALPEIENEANRLLGRMTDNRMSIKFETQEETKPGTVSTIPASPTLRSP